MGKPRVKVTVKDNGYKETIKAIHKAGEGWTVTVGVHAEADGNALLKAQYLEDRSQWLSGFIDSRGDEFVAKMAAETRAAIAAKKNPVQRADQLAQELAGQIQANFENLQPPNAEETIRRKGSSVVGVDTGQLRSSITGKVSGV